MNESEKQIQNKIIELLLLAGHYVWRNNTGQFKVDLRYIKAGKKGSSDIIGIHKSTGQFIALEIKKPSTIKKTTIEQDDFLEQIRSRGGIARVVTSEEDVMDLVQI